MKAFSVNIIGLGNKTHHFEYAINDEFFRHYGSGLLSEGRFNAEITLHKHETFIEAEFAIAGTARLTCDRSLEQFDYPVNTNHKVVFKYGDEDREISDDIVMIHRDTVTLELGQFIYEFIGLAIPMKKLHPKFQESDEEADETTTGNIVYSSGTEENENEEPDPRWEKLKKLK